MSQCQPEEGDKSQKRAIPSINGSFRPSVDEYASRPGFESAAALSRNIFNTFTGGALAERHNLNDLIRLAFSHDNSSIEVRQKILIGLADAMPITLESFSSIYQMSHVFVITQQIVGLKEALNPQLRDAHLYLGDTVVRILDQRSNQQQSSFAINDMQLRNVLYQIVRELLRSPYFVKSASSESLEQMIPSELTKISDAIEEAESIDNNQIDLMSSLASCCEAIQSSLLEDALVRSFKVIDQLLYTFDEPEETDDNLDDEDDNEVEDDWSDEDIPFQSMNDDAQAKELDDSLNEDEDNGDLHRPVDQSDDDNSVRLKIGIREGNLLEPIDDSNFKFESLDFSDMDEDDFFSPESVANSLLKALVFCQSEGNQISLWESALKRYDPADVCWGSALIGISLVKLDATESRITHCLCKAAEYEVKFAHKQAFQNKTSHHFSILIELAVVNRDTWPVLEGCVSQLSEEQRKAVSSTFRRAIANHDLEFDAPYQTGARDEEELKSELIKIFLP
jgi:hypothetical protein